MNKFDQADSPKIWQRLRQHHAAIAGSRLTDLFEREPARTEMLCLQSDGLLVDYSKHFVSSKTLTLLTELASVSGLGDLIDDLFNGAEVNRSERRAALHTALRAPESSIPRVGGADVSGKIHRELKKMLALAEEFNSGRKKGWTGKPVSTLVNIGIGGSDLGIRMSVEALHSETSTQVALQFVNNIDDQSLYPLLHRLQPETTAFVVSSKSFGTSETLTNAAAARHWLTSHGCPSPELQFFAVTANTDAAIKFGIKDQHVLRIWDWVGGRYSVWSSVGLPLATELGADGFRDFLHGAHRMDEHFRNTSMEINIPVLHALIGIWYYCFFGVTSHCIVPYDQRLRLFPEFLGQLIMESNGKSVTQSGEPVANPTAPVIWGGTGTSAQHAFFQLLHQGTRVIPVDFLVAARGQYNQLQHDMLVANCLAQSEALMCGRTTDEDRHRQFTGNRPSTVIFYDQLTPATLGQLIAMYEHSTFVQAAILGINPFDQWGVELGKTLAQDVLEVLQAANDTERDQTLSSSTRDLLAHYRRYRAGD